MAPKTLYDKIWDAHVAHEAEDGTCLLYIDRHLVHEVTSPQAFEGLRIANRQPWRLSANLATPDHNVPTTDRKKGIEDPISRTQVETLDQNCDHFGITEFKMNDIRQGVVHVVGPEQGATLPAMKVEIVGPTAPGITAKDIVLAIIGEIGTAGGTGYAIEFAGQGITDLSMEGRMTLCNMAIEGGARSGFVAVDQKTIDYVKDRPYAPTEAQWDQAVAYWNTLHSDEGAQFDKVVSIEGSSIKPQVTWGTSPEMVVSVDANVPDPAKESDAVKAEGMSRALTYMGLEANTPINQIAIDKVFIGSCTNSRIEDLRAAAEVTKGRKVADNVKLALVVPGSGLVKQQAESEGLDKIFTEAGFEWREPGCSMCLAMNADRLGPGERCASTSNRNFEGRQGQGGRTHLVSPAMAAAAAVAGHFVDVREL